MKLRTFFLLGTAALACIAFSLPDQWFAFAGWLAAFGLSALFQISERRREKVERSHISVGELLKSRRNGSSRGHEAPTLPRVKL